jgi:hypothetical protein
MLSLKGIRFDKTKMKNEHPHRNHEEILAKVAETEEITAPTERDLGSFVVRQLKDGEYVPLGAQHVVEVDFSRIDILDGPLEEQFDEFKQRLAADPEKAKLNEALAVQSAELQETFRAALFSAEMSRKFFRGAFDLSTKDRRDALGWLDLDPSREDSYKVKKLSETVDDGVCAEYSLLTGEIMKRLGQEVDYTVGYKKFWRDDEPFYHAFLMTDDSRVLIDVYGVAESYRENKPQGLLVNEEGGILQHPDGFVVYKDIFGRTNLYSATREHVINEAKAA